MQKTICSFGLVLATAMSLSPAHSSGQGTQLAGSVGIIGKPATLGKYQFTLVGARFATRLAHKEDVAIAKKGMKFLVVSYMIQNPSSTELSFDWGEIQFTMVGADGADHENEKMALNPDTMATVSNVLKPVQKIPLVTFIEVPANDPIPKLMVASGKAPVLRFDLKGKVKPFTGPYASKDGIVVKDGGEAKVGEKFECGPYDVQIGQTADVNATIGDKELGDGQKFIVVTATFTNAASTPQNIDWGNFTAKLKDAAGEAVDYVSLFKSGSDVPLNNPLKPGESVKGRFIFMAAKATTGASVTIGYGDDGRSVTVPIK